eukprot:evm.model.scf_973.3 EVM.evm.TU.scf_973.3   scf_973:13528-18101(-)
MAPEGGPKIDGGAVTDDDWIATAAKALRVAGSVAAESAQSAVDTAQVFVETGRAHMSMTEDLLVSYAIDGFKWARENQEMAYAGLALSAIVVLPGARQWAIRQMFRSFQSEESMFRSAERRLERLKTNLDSYTNEGQKLERRLHAAAEEYERGMHKLRSTSRQLSALSGQVKKEAALATALLKDLRYMPSKPALALRSEVATKLASLKRQGNQIDGNIYSIAKKGI